MAEVKPKWLRALSILSQGGELEMSTGHRICIHEDHMCVIGTREKDGVAKEVLLGLGWDFDDVLAELNRIPDDVLFIKAAEIALTHEKRTR